MWWLIYQSYVFRAGSCLRSSIIRSEIVSISTYILELSLYPHQRNLQYHSSSSLNINKNIAIHIIDHHKCMPSSTKGHGAHVIVELKQETQKSKNIHCGDNPWGQGPSAGCRTTNSQHGGAEKKGRCYIVTCLAWIAAKLISSNSEMRYVLAASWRAITVEDWNQRSVYIYSQCNERKDRTHLEILSNFTDKTLEREFTNEELGRFLVTTNFMEGNSSRVEAMRLLHTTCCGLIVWWARLPLINDERVDLLWKSYEQTWQWVVYKGLFLDDNIEPVSCDDRERRFTSGRLVSSLLGMGHCWWRGCKTLIVLEESELLGDKT